MIEAMTYVQFSSAYGVLVSGDTVGVEVDGQLLRVFIYTQIRWPKSLERLGPSPIPRPTTDPKW